ncbi:MAG TPA: DUF433 domain-containing protein, partial [Nitrospirales bacterium]|nr:DUF433 domain-containing protein [Nitrospirales bacterium]
VKTTMEVFPGITMTSDICHGKPCVAGTVVDVATIVGTLGIGKSFDDVQEALNLTYEQILTALRYASYVTDHLPLRLPSGH